MLFSIIICTHNRDTLLNHAITAISKATKSKCTFEVIVVDNASTDGTVAVCKKLQDTVPIVYIYEHRVGLSVARNTGAEAAKSNWLIYLDDDGKITQNTLIEVERTISNFPFDMFTGIFTAWDYFDTPKWFPKDWSSYIIRGSHTIRSIGDDYVTGNIMAIKRDLLLELGGFPVNLGMKGSEVAYGEESYIADQVKAMGKAIGFNPFMVLEHVVADYKLNLKWLMSAYRARGRSYALRHQPTLFNLPSVFWLSIKRLAINTMKGLWSLLTKPDYYWQNFYLDVCGTQASFNVIISSILKKGDNS